MKLQSGDICSFFYLPKGTQFYPMALDGEGKIYTKTDDYGRCILINPLQRFTCKLDNLCKIVDLPFEYEILTYREAEFFAVKQQNFATKLGRP